MIAALLGALLALAAAPAGASAAPEDEAVSVGRDYQLGHKGWNGLSQLGALAGELGCPAESRPLLEWDTLTGRDVLFFLFPETPIDDEALLAYLAAGGRAIVADDFGEAGPALLRLGVRRHEGALPASLPTFRDQPGLQLATPSRATPLGQAAGEVVTNHPAYFTSARPASYAFSPGLDLVIEGGIGRGRFVAVADPSLFINNMMAVPQDRAFATHLLADLCRRGAEQPRDRLLIVSGLFRQRGVPPAALPGAPESAEPNLAGTPPGELPAALIDRANRALSGLNLHIQESLARGGGGLDAAALCGLVLTIAALLLQLRHLPLSAMPHDTRFAQPRRPARGLHAQISRYAHKGVPFAHPYPAALLREEVLARLLPYLTAVPSPHEAPPAKIEAAVAAQVGPAAGALAATLWRELQASPRIPTSAASAGQALDPAAGSPRGVTRLAGGFVSERRMDRLYQTAVALFAELDAAHKDA